MFVLFKKLHPAAVTPTRGTEGSAGFDLTVCAYSFSRNPKQITYHSGIAVEIPEGHVGLVFPRSSICKVPLRLCNAVGVIDSDYRGEITGVFDLLPEISECYKPGERFAQLVIVPIPKVEFIEVEELSETKRGTGGYGSTGR